MNTGSSRPSPNFTGAVTRSTSRPSCSSRSGWGHCGRGSKLGGSNGQQTKKQGPGAKRFASSKTTESAATAWNAISSMCALCVWRAIPRWSASSCCTTRRKDNEPVSSQQHRWEKPFLSNSPPFNHKTRLIAFFLVAISLSHPSYPPGKPS